LQLDPINAHHLERLEAAAGAAVIASRGPKSASLAALLSVVNGRELTRRYAHLEDPAEDVFCEEISGPGGAYLAGNGLTGQSVFALRTVVKALFRYSTPDDDLVVRLLPLVMGGLSLSDGVLRHAGLKRGLQWKGKRGGRVGAPTNFEQLVEAVRLDLDDKDRQWAEQTLGPLIIDSQGLAGVTPNELFQRPFLLEDDALIVVLPFEIASALRHRVALDVVEHGLQDAFQLRCCVAVSETVTESMTRMGMVGLHREDAALPWPTSNLPMVETVFRFDTDKLAYVLTVVDDFRDYSESELFQTWPLADLEDVVSERIDQVSTHLLARRDTAEVLTVVALAPLDRGATLTVQAERSPLLCMHVRELEALSFSERGDQLGLWKFVRARATLAQQAKVHAFSPLDLYVPYREHSHSFAFLEMAEVLVANPGAAGVLAHEAATRYDVHPAPHPSGAVVEVERWLPHAPSVPIYLPHLTLGPGFECLIEHQGTLFVWICSPGSDAGAAVGHTLAYWLWQVTSDIEEDLETLSDGNGVVRIEVDLAPATGWQVAIEDLTASPADEDAPFAETYPLPQPPNGLRLLAGAWLALHSADNSGERRILSALLTLILNSDDADSRRRIAAIVERHAPVGYKKHLMFSRGPDPRLVEQGLPAFRPVQSHDRIEANRVVSALTLAQLEPRRGDDEAAAHQLLHAYVRAGYRELGRRVAELSPSGLLEHLVLLNERVVNEQGQQQASGLTRLLCYGDLDEEIAARPDELARIHRAGVCTRFLIEYVAACPPSGTGEFSVATFDELLALASEILDAGALSDAIRARVPGPRIVILPTRRIIFMNDEEATQSHDAFLVEQVASEVAAGDALLEGMVWRPDEEIAELPEELDRALLAEFGLRLSEAFEFLNTVIEMGLDRDAGLAVLRVAEVQRHVARLPGWNPEKAAKAIETFALAPRSIFDDPPKPHRPSDVFPWRVNRSLSHVRRPLIRRGNELIFGIRHFYNAQMHLASLLEAGRFPARSRELIKLQGKRGNLVGRAFEDAVGRLFRSQGLPVRVRVRKVAGVPLEGEGGRSLGDIDVLVVDRSHQRIVVIDAKALAPAITPSELGIELADLFGSDSASAVARQLARCRWVEEHRRLVLSWFGVSDESVECAGWDVVPLIVTDRPLLSSHLAKPQIRVVSYATLERELGR
jgi:hypothetical protein